MNAGKAVYGILSTNAEVTAIVGTKIFPEVAEQETALPLIVYQLQSVAPEDTHDGPSKLDEVRFEFLCYADTYNGAADLGDKVRGALDRVSGTYNAVNVESVQFNDVDIDVIDAPRRYGQSLTFTFRIKRDDVEIAQGTPVTGAMLGDLYNVDVAGVTDNQILSYDAATGNWVPADDAGGLVDSVNGLTGTVILNFDDLNDVDTGTPSDGQLIAYQQGEWVTIDQDEIHIPINSVTGLQTELNTIPTDLSDLSDVSIVGTPAGNQALIYNSATNAFTSQDSYTNRFEDEVETGKVMPTIFAERAYSVKSEGDGVFIDPESDTPAAGKVIVRKIYHKAGFITDADVIGDYTLIHTFADDTAYTDTVATFEGFEDGATYGVPPFTLLQTWEEVTAAPTFTGLLNESYGSGAAAGYGTRRLNGNYTGACMTIRRASDGTTQAIGFVGEEIDESAITTFCTGTSCTVQVWHDQSQTGGTGSGNDATQTDSTKQPTIYTGGALVKEGGRLALDFDGTSDSLTSTTPPFSGTTNRTSFTVSKANTATSSDIIYGINSIAGATGTAWQLTSETQLRVSGRIEFNNSAQTIHSLGTLIFNGTTVNDANFYLNGSITTQGTSTGATINTDNTDWAIGNTPTNNTFYDGKQQELIFYASDKSTDRTSIEGNISAYYQSAKLLDEQFGSGAEAAYSVRQLKRDNTECMVIRRASDSTTTTIGFDASGNIDEAAITTFCTGTTCTLYQWLDQSGNGNTATAASTGVEPTIYTGGALVKENGKVAVENVLSGAQGLNIPSFTINLSDFTCTLVSKFYSDSSTEGKPVMINGDTQASYDYRYKQFSITRNRFYLGTSTVQSFNNSLSYTSSTNQQLHTITPTNGYVDGTSAGTFGTAGEDLDLNPTFNYLTSGDIGRDRGTHANSSEVIIWTAEKTSTDRTDIEENIGDYFTQNTPLLDTYSGAAAAYSLRLLDSSYVGSAIRVRRSSDNTEQDIGFNVFGELDTVSLLDFAGAGDAFVKTWYDQASTNDATQTTTANQPKIVSSGAVIVENGKPAVEFDGSNDGLASNSGPLNGEDSYTVIYLVNPLTSNINYETFLQEGDPPSPYNNMMQFRRAASSDRMDVISGSLSQRGTTPSGTSINSKQNLFGLYRTSNTSNKLYLNGTLSVTLTNNNFQITSSKFTLGVQNSASPYDSTQKAQELIFYTTDESANRTGIESNINTFYSIY